MTGVQTCALPISGIGSFCVSGRYICAGVDGLIVIGSDHLIWIGRGLEMEEGAQVDVGSEADRWWIIVASGKCTLSSGWLRTAQSALEM